jgi:hypothetical protein
MSKITAKKTNPNKKSKSLKNNAGRKEGNCNANVLDGECKNQHVQCTKRRVKIYFGTMPAVP